MTACTQIRCSSIPLELLALFHAAIYGVETALNSTCSLGLANVWFDWDPGVHVLLSPTVPGHALKELGRDCFDSYPMIDTVVNNSACHGE